MTVVGPSISSTLCYLFKGEGRGRNNKGRKHTVPFPNPLLAAARASFECCGEGGGVSFKMWEKRRSWADCMSKICRIIFLRFHAAHSKKYKKETSQKDILLAGQSVANYPAGEVRLPVFERRRSDPGSRSANERRNETCVWIPKRGKNKIKASTQFLAHRSVNFSPPGSLQCLSKKVRYRYSIYL